VALNVPTLDDRTYEDLVREGIELIPSAAPGWTNHNASDPGITLVELFAYLTEIYLYRADRVSLASKVKFLRLLTGIADSDLKKLLLPAAVTAQSDAALDAKLRDGDAQSHAAVDSRLHAAVVAMRVPSRAVSEADFERLAATAIKEAGQAQRVVRVHCYPRRNFEAASAAERLRDRPGHTTVVFVPADPRLHHTELTAIARTIKDRLEPRRLLTSRVHVVPPRYVDVAVRIRVAIAASKASSIEDKIRKDVEEEYRSWPLGRGVYTSDLYRRLGTIHGVLRVLGIEWSTDHTVRLLRSETGDVVGVHLEADELPRVTVSGVVCDVHS
jgi:hypothetical protein